MNGTVAMVLAGGRVDSMGVLTAHRSQAAVPFGGMYRIIDFCLTNLSESGVEKVGILSQYRPQSLMDHVGIGRPWDYNGRTRELSFLPPYEGLGAHDWYRGTADAVFQNLHFIERHAPEQVLVLAGDHVYRMNYGPILEFHRRHKADLTLVFKPMDPGRPSRFGIGVVARDGRVTDYQEKPEDPRSDLVSLTIYCFRTEALIARLHENAASGRTFHLYDEVIPRMVAEDRVYGYVFRGGWEYARPLSEWYDLHMRLCEPGGIGVPMDRVRTNLEQQGLGTAPPAFLAASARVRRSLAAPGCVVAGRVSRSVLFPFVRVEPGAEVSESVLLHGCVVRCGAGVFRAVLDKGVEVGEGALVDGTRGLVAIPKGTRIAPAETVTSDSVRSTGAGGSR